MCALALTLSTTLASQPAHAEPGTLPGPGGTLPIGIGATSNQGYGSGLPAGTLTGTSGTPGAAGTGLASSSYTLSQVDPISQTMTMGALGTQMNADYAMTATLADAGMMAIDAAEMARTARLAEEARRAAIAAAVADRGGDGLKPGSVPAEYEGLIYAAVAEYCPQLSPSILAAQIEAESNWNPRARSSVGAQGIAQFMPGTWSSWGVDGNGNGTKSPWEPADAIKAAARYDCYIRDYVRKVPGDLDSNMLAGYNAGPGRVTQYQGVPPYTETRNYVAKILARAAELADSGDPGSAGTSAGCPTTAPSGTLRDGAAALGIGRICADSVAAASSPEAARAIKYTLRNLGAPYSQANRMQSGYYDCSSYVMRAYQAAGANVLQGGWAPNTYAIENISWGRHIPFASRKPGDLVYPFQGHIAMSLAHGLKVHTNRPGDVSHVNSMYSSAYLTVRVDPARV